MSDQREAAACPKCGAAWQPKEYSLDLAKWTCGSFPDKFESSGFNQSPQCRIRELTAANAKLQAELAEAKDELENDPGDCADVRLGFENERLAAELAEAKAEIARLSVPWPAWENSDHSPSCPSKERYYTAGNGACPRCGTYGERINGIDVLRQLAEAKTECERLRDENTHLRAALAVSKDPCVYCQLPKEEMAKCKSGFPGCARMDDLMGCPEFGSMLNEQHLREELEAARRDGERLVKVIATVAAPLEALRYTECDKPAKALHPSLNAAIIEASDIARAALGIDAAMGKAGE